MTWSASSFFKRQVVLLLCFAAVTCAGAGLELWFGNTAENIAALKAGTLNPYREFNEWINGFIFSVEVSKSVMNLAGDKGGYYLLCYMRDLIAGTAIYWLTAGIWHWVIYDLNGKSLFEDKGRPYPDKGLIRNQQMLAQLSLFMYAGLPILSEYLIEEGHTKVFFYVEEVGWKKYAIYFTAYLTLVEIGIYWMHRKLHENKFLYNYVHALHHTYDHHSTLTPWASIAFNPIDGLCQASPYVAMLFVVPMHYFTHVFLLFFSGMWATNIHDAMWLDSEPIMGAKYHTLHHTHFKCNYGQFFIFCDWFFGTLIAPGKEAFFEKAKLKKEQRSVRSLGASNKTDVKQE